MLGLALEGGGAKGAYHMGAVKAYREEGYVFDGVAGTSIGAINGAMIAQGDFDAAYRMWENMDNSLLFDIEEMQMEKILNRHFDWDSLSFLKDRIRAIIENRGLDTSKIRGILNQIIDEEKLRQSKVDLGIVTVSLSDLEPVELFKEDIPQGKLVDYIMASANVPIFKIEPIDGKYFIDGAFYDNCPINLLVRKGYKDIIAVRTLGLGLHRKVEDEGVNLTTLIPSENLGTVLNFDNSVIQVNLKMGYFDAMRVLKNLVGMKYYIDPSGCDLILRSLWNIPEESVYRIGTAMALPKMEPRRLLFERIFPELFKLLELPATASYQDVVVGVLEYAAVDQGIDRFAIRTLVEFIDELHNEFHGAPSAEEGNILPVRTRLAARFAKQTVLTGVAKEFISVLKREQSR